MTEQQYLDNLFAQVSKTSVRDAYVEPVLKRLVAKSKREKLSYEGVFNALKWAARRIAENWQLEHGSMFGTGLSKASQTRQIDNLTRSFVEIYQIRSRQ